MNVSAAWLLSIFRFSVACAAERREGERKGRGSGTSAGTCVISLSSTTRIRNLNHNLPKKRSILCSEERREASRGRPGSSLCVRRKLQLDLENPGRGTHPKRQDFLLGSHTSVEIDVE